ncbi:MAG: hypothetical protein ACK559_39805, partial [bacterium]
VDVSGRERLVERREACGRRRRPGGRRRRPGEARAGAGRIGGVGDIRCAPLVGPQRLCAGGGPGAPERGAPGVGLEALDVGAEVKVAEL